MSAVTQLQAAIDAVIQADATLAARLAGDKVYSDLSPRNETAFPHIVIGQASEVRKRTFDSKFQDTILTLDVWSADLSKYEAMLIVGDMERLLDATALVVTGHHFVTGELSLLAVMLDPSAKYVHATLHYEALNYV